MITIKKLKGFTLSEMIVVLLLTTIVVGLAFTVLHLVEKHMESIQSNLTYTTELRQLEQALWLDFNRYPRVIYNPSNQTLSFSNTVHEESYIFNALYILKDKDTFNLKVNHKTFYFDGELILEGRLDALKLEFMQGKQAQNIFVFKTNDATLYMD